MYRVKCIENGCDGCLGVFSYYSPVLEDALDMVQVEGADAHETECFKECHIHILSLIVINRLVVRVLPDHRHLALRHQILNAFVNLSNH